MRLPYITTLVCTLMCTLLYSQYTLREISLIKNLDQAKEYTEGRKNISLTIINSENDPFIFEELDTTDLKSNVGRTVNFMGRMNKLIMDTTISVARVQTISIDLTRVPKETATTVLQEIKEKLDGGMSFWDLKYSYKKNGVDFASGPCPTQQIHKKYDLDLNSEKKGDVISVHNESNMGFMILVEEVKTVPAFYSLSYNQI